MVLILLAFLLTVPVASAQSRIGTVRSWAYWLQNPDLRRITESPFDVAVVDYSRDGSEDEAFTAAEVQQPKAAGKRVLAYLSIGEAEEVRFYFKSSWVRRSRPTGSAPEWLSASNPDFPDNYKVRFWSSRWQKVIFGRPSGPSESYLDRIIDAGFSGVYLDIIDAFEDGGLAAIKTRTGTRGIQRNARDMARFVVKLARYARERRGVPGFIVVPQNGSTILDYLPDSLRTEYLDAIDAIGAEDTFFIGDEDQNNPLDVQDEVVDALAEYRAAGKTILSIDYLTVDSLIAQYRSLACAEGYVPQVSTRELDTLQANRLSGCGG